MALRVRPQSALAAVGAVTFAIGIAAAPTPAPAQSNEPIKIGFSLALTGPLAPNGKQALLGAKIWQEEINAKDGLLGRKVVFVNYDDNLTRRIYRASTPSCSTSTKSISLTGPTERIWSHRRFPSLCRSKRC